ncbi:GcrA family cell cycle regulator [Caulobacter sp. FWC26]|uniref:GcrA family cell cycle regulator n=1 Tax=Caulobacter sp. FWC26 TaxID=69665 RepID=UPI000C14E607|nr:GcrA family cell cycle regulator [Caulobacter sp. FWC26]AZS19199.1 GcrA cell cycle regulator [Caulobacter sp. FWC26]
MSSSVSTSLPEGSGWSEVRVARLKALWAEGLSASRIAAVLGAVSRNAVIGKIHRLGLAGRVPPAPPGGRATIPPRVRRPGKRPSPPRPPAGPRPPGGAPARSAARPRATAVLVEAVGLAADLCALPRGGCHWPLGDPKHPDFSFCGQAAPRPPYCAAHRARAYRCAPAPARGGRVRRAA